MDNERAGERTRTHGALAVASRLRLLDALRVSDRPLDVRELAAACELHVTTVRFHLDVLTDAGLVTSRAGQSGTRGRPRRLYTPASRAVAAGGPIGYELLSGILAAHWAEDRDDRAQQAEQAGWAWAGQREPRPAAAAATLAEAAVQVNAVFAELGFDPELVRDDEQPADPPARLPVSRRRRDTPGGGLLDPPGSAPADAGRRRCPTCGGQPAAVRPAASVPRPDRPGRAAGPRPAEPAVTGRRGQAVNTGLAAVVQLAVPFVWLGMVLAISFLETPLKFRAPGITVPLGLGIGRLVFRALNAAEVALAVTLTLALVASTAGEVTIDGAATTVLIAIWTLLVVQVAVLRPRLDRRAQQLIHGQSPPRSHLHLAYVAAECAKVVLLPTLGIVLAHRLMP